LKKRIIQIYKKLSEAGRILFMKNKRKNINKKYKIVFTDYYFPDINKEINILKKLGNIEIVDCNEYISKKIDDEEKILYYLRKMNAVDADALLVNHAIISEKIISQLKNCKIIARYGVGVDNINVEAAKKRGIIISNVPDYCVEEVSDNAVAFILECQRKIVQLNHIVKNDIPWNYEKIKPIRRLSNLTIGLLAFGKIARKVAEKLFYYNLNIIAYDPYFGNKEQYNWVKFVTLDELLNNSDVISVHAPLTKETYHLIDEDSILKMKNGVYIINTSRGGLIDEIALYNGIKSGKIAGAGLDVLEYNDENDYSKSPLIELENVIITPHTSWYSEEALNELQIKTAKNVYKMLSEGRPLYEVK